MTTARNIIKKRLKKHGNTLLGVGVYSAVIDQGSKQNKVIKIGNTLTDPWLDYYQNAIACSNNPHFPTVYSFHHDQSNEYYVAVVEKLLPEHPEGNATNSNLSCLQEIFRIHAGSQSDYETFKDEIWANADTFNGSFYTDVEQLWSAIYAIKQLRDDTWNYETEEYEYAVDMHAGNLMFRQDGTLVLNDPLSDTEIEFEDDLAQWADEHIATERLHD